MRRGWVLVLAGALLLAPWPTKAAEQERQEKRMETQQQEQQAYGWQLMTPAERLEYRNRLRAAHTEQEREEIRAEHHEQMKERAKQQGVTLPEEPGPWGKGQGMGPGPGGGRGGRY
jgi:hypothetical protein